MKVLKWVVLLLMLFSDNAFAAGDGILQALWLKDLNDLDSLYTSGGIDNDVLEDGDLIIIATSDGISFYRLSLTSGATEDGLSVIAPDEISDGVAYTGDARWLSVT